MSKEEFIDRLFETINEAHNLSVKDIDTDAAENTITVYLTDGAAFKIRCEDCAHINS
ncbi:MAG: hypothetical protein NC489_29670 [Ruminococcus flavefaciens]|nr:hypothetical protein [Ruminococcus flavefaciens]